MVGKSTGDYQLKCTLYQYYSTGIVTLLKWPWLSGTLLVDNHDCGSLKGFAVKSYYSMTIIIKNVHVVLLQTETLHKIFSGFEN